MLPILNSSLKFFNSHRRSYSWQRKKLVRSLIKIFIISLCLAYPFFSFAAPSLREKIGQMLMVGFKGTDISAEDPMALAILSAEVGGVILFDYDFNTKTYDRNIQHPEQLKKLINKLQTFSKEAAKKNKGLYPLLISIDYEGGKVNRLKENDGFPKTFSAAEIAKLSPLKAKQEANRMAQTLAQEGINFNYAPVLDLNLNPDNPVIGKLNRSFSSDVNIVIQMASLFSNAYQKHGILCAYKHFPGHGSSTNDSHLGFVDVTKTWKLEELKPYEVLIQTANACPLIMTAHIINKKLDSKGLPASLSREMSEVLLRKKLKFKGLIVTDDMQMKAITENFSLKQALILAVNAGADMLVFGNQLVATPIEPKALIDIIEKAVEKGEIDERRINEAYKRILDLKKNLRKHLRAPLEI